MSGDASLGVSGFLGFLQLAAGGAVLLLPGLAAADRFLGLRRRGWMFAPVFSLTLLPITAIVLDLAFQAPVRAPLTLAYAFAWAAALEWPRRHQLLRFLKSWGEPLVSWRPTAPSPLRLLHGLAVVAVLGGVAAVHSVPHTPGDEASWHDAYPRLAGRVLAGFDGGDYPYPIHVDEHYHLSHQAAIARTGHIGIDDPYTGEPFASPLFSIQGFRDERGFDLAMAQVHQVTGMSLPAQARFLPAFEVAVLAGLLYATLAPAPGALASAALVAIVPTTVRFLGPGFLVPSAFALPWVVTAIHVSLRAQGGRRLAALALLETAAYFLHLVLGTLVLAAATAAALARPGRRIDRIALGAVGFLPLLWIGPLVAEQVALALVQEHTLPFQPAILLAGGWLAIAAAVLGATVAVLRHEDAMRPHIVFAALGLALTTSLFVSIEAGHHSDATYSRLIPTWFVCVAALAGLGLATVARQARRLRWAPAVPLALGVLVLAVAAPAVGSQLSTPYYRLFDEASWEDARVLARSDAGPEDLLLCDPWLAPIYNMASGARLHTVLYPGVPPEKGSDWGYYLASGGADEEWLRARGITLVAGPVPPNATHDPLGGGVYRLDFE